MFKPLLKLHTNYENISAIIELCKYCKTGFFLELKINYLKFDHYVPITLICLNFDQNYNELQKRKCYD